MFGAFQTFGKLGAIGKAIAAWSPARLFANGEAGAWYDPSDLSTMFNDSAGTTPVATPGTVADSANPVGLIQDKSGNGHHASQSTSTARPLLSARRNLLTYTEDFSNAVWQLLFGLEKTPNYGLAPDGTMTACRLYAPTTDGVLFGHGVVNASLTRGAWMKSNTSSSYTVTLITTPCTVTPTWTFFEAPFNGNEYRWNMSVPAAGDISIWHPQVELGTTATTYQRVTTDSDYDGDPTKFPYYLKFDGVDDCLSTAAIDLTGTDKVTVFSGSRVLSSNIAIFYETNTNAIAGGAFYATSNEQATNIGTFLVSGTGGGGVKTLTGQPAHAVTTAQFSSVFTTAIDAAAANVNGVAQSMGIFYNPGPSTGNFGNWPLHIGARSGPSLSFNGNIYSLIIAGALYDAPVVDEAEAWVAGKTGVTL